MKAYLLIAAILFISCNEKSSPPDSKEDGILEVELHKALDDDMTFDPIFTTFPIYSSENNYPAYEEGKRNHFKNIPVVDSFKIISKVFQYEPFITRLYRDGYISENKATSRLSRNELKKYLESSVDTLNFELNVLSAFKDDKQLLIPDTDNDGDFGNNETLIFDANYRKSRDDSDLEAFETKVAYEVFHNDDSYSLTRDIQLVPRTNHMFAYLVMDSVIDDNINQYTAILKIRDYRKGEINLENEEYLVGVQGLLVSKIVKTMHFSASRFSF